MWELATTELYEHDAKHYLKKRPRELQAVKRNLARYLEQLKQAPNSRAVKIGFLHDEPDGVIAIDQSGGGKGLQETRLYTFADDNRRTLWLITIGNKAEQPKDIQLSSQFVESLRASDPST